MKEKGILKKYVKICDRNIFLLFEINCRLVFVV